MNMNHARPRVPHHLREQPQLTLAAEDRARITRIGRPRMVCQNPGAKLFTRSQMLPDHQSTGAVKGSKDELLDISRPAAHMSD